MTCRDVIEFLMEYRSGTLPGDQRAAFEEHLERCPECVAYMKSYDEAVRLGKGAHRQLDDRVSDDVPEELVQAILAARRKQT
jgi:anti-sigma factor RsiW